MSMYFLPIVLLSSQRSAGVDVRAIHHAQRVLLHRYMYRLTQTAVRMLMNTSVSSGIRVPAFKVRI